VLATDITEKEACGGKMLCKGKSVSKPNGVTVRRQCGTCGGQLHPADAPILWPVRKHKSIPKKAVSPVIIYESTVKEAR